MSTPKLYSRVENLESEVQELKQRIAQAKAASRRASAQLAQISRRRDELSVSAFDGDVSAIEELRQLEQQAVEENQAADIAGKAAKNLTEALSEREAELSQAYDDEHDRHARVLRDEMDALQGETIRECVEPLRAKLDEMVKLCLRQENHHRDAGRPVNLSSYRTPRQRTRAWLRQQLGEWIDG